jgi:hypothetical protein
MAELSLLPAVRQQPDAIVVADGTSRQIRDGAQQPFMWLSCWHGAIEGVDTATLTCKLGSARLQCPKQLKKAKNGYFQGIKQVAAPINTAHQLPNK